MTMRDTTFQTVTLPPLALAAGGRVNTLVTANDVPMRVLVRNLSGVQMFFGTASESMIGDGAPGTKVYQLPPGQETTFILAPRQQLFACANGAGALCSFSVSDALPISSSTPV